MKNKFILLGISTACIAYIYFAMRPPSESLPVSSNATTPESTNHSQIANTKQQPYNGLLAANSIPAVEFDETNIETTSFQVENPKGRVLIVRGIMTVFSLGLNELGSKLQELGYDVRVTPAVKSSYAADSMCKKIKQANDGLPLIIIGHSLGGDLAPDLSRTFGKQNLSVDLVVMLDSTHPTAPPANVKRCINLYQADRKTLFKGASIRSNQRATEIFNINIREIAESQNTSNIDHFNIDENPWIHQMIVSAVEKNGAISSPADLVQGIDFEQVAKTIQQTKTKTKKPSTWLNRIKRR